MHLAALRARDLQGTELAAMAQVLRQARAPLKQNPKSLVDTRGTGGDGATSTFQRLWPLRRQPVVPTLQNTETEAPAARLVPLMFSKVWDCN